MAQLAQQVMLSEEDVRVQKGLFLVEYNKVQDLEMQLNQANHQIKVLKGAINARDEQIREKTIIVATQLTRIQEQARTNFNLLEKNVEYSYKLNAIQQVFDGQKRKWRKIMWGYIHDQFKGLYGYDYPEAD